MLWKKQALCCGFAGETTKTELGEYSILDTTITQYGSISAFFRPPQGRARKPSKHQCIGMHFETIGKAKACCEEHLVENGGNPETHTSHQHSRSRG